jgi:putative transposase
MCLGWNLTTKHSFQKEPPVLPLVAIGEHNDIHLLAFHIEPEHVHVLFSLPPAVSVAVAVKQLKGASSRRLRQAFPHLAALHHDALWNRGYFVRSLGDVNVAQAKAYLDRQRQHHIGAKMDGPGQ